MTLFLLEENACAPFHFEPKICSSEVQIWRFLEKNVSPVPRPGSTMNGEVCPAASPLSKSSSCTNSYTPTGALLSSFGSLDYAIYKPEENARSYGVSINVSSTTEDLSVVDNSTSELNLVHVELKEEIAYNASFNQSPLTRVDNVP
ncbi:hypothetical protein HAX54_019817 [Datura stramonium]|uniref:Uncharacterized protein n=1 Tax=Datura stramonium TaxID=4076 RepID=A0ABS8US74_DATST|nr:hypothetical protein [Datura stramonium]